MAIRILYLDHAPFWGGAERVLVTHLKLLDKSRFIPLVAISVKSPEFKEQFEKAGAKVLAIPFARLKTLNPFVAVRFAQSVLAVRSIIIKNNIDLVVTNTSRAFYPGVLATKLARIPIVAWVHDFLYIKSLFKMVLPLTSGVIWTSDAARKFYGVRLNESSRVIYPENQFQEELREVTDEDAAKLRDVWGASERDVVIGYVGRIVKSKGVDVLIRAVAAIKRAIKRLPLDNVNFKLIIVGSGRGQRGSNEEELKNLVSSLNLEENVIFIGFRESPAVFYKAFDVFVLPSISAECYPTVVVEAMLAKLPVVGTRLGGIVEQIEDEKTGFLVSPGSVSELALKLETLCLDGALRERMGQAGRKKALEENAGIGATKEMEKLFLKIAGSCRKKI